MKPHTRAIFNIITVLSLLAVLIGTAAFPTSAHAFGATITVTSILDNTTTDTYCSLREAIINANNNAATSPDCSAGIGADAIVFSDLLVVYTITLGSTLPGINDAAGLTIYGADTFTVSGNDLYRVFIVNAGKSLTLDGLTVTHGKAVFGVSGVGGGVESLGTLTITNCLFSGNSSVGGVGGGIFHGGTLTITDSIFSGNTATYISGNSGYGGAIYSSYGTVTITRTIFSGNSADIRGGGIYNYFGTMNITDSRFTNNSMSSPGDGGGGIYNDQSTMTITHSTFTGNAANSSGSNGGGIFNSLGALTITRSTFSNNSVTTGVGGGIASNGTLTIGNSTFSSNFADFGAGVYNGIGGVMTSTNNTFSGNSTFFTTVVGGGVYNEGTLNLYNTILANTVNGGDCYNISGTVNGTNNLIEAAAANACGLTNGVSGNIIGSDPSLGAATLLNPIYFPLNASSPAINAGDDVKCAAAPVNNTSQNGVTRPQGAQCDIGSFELPVTTLALKSVGADDGWILESTETSGVGGTLNATATTFNVGDDAGNKQYRSILHFDTSGLPDAAVIIKVTLKIRKQGLVGVNPFNVLGGLLVDMRKPSFGAAALAPGDFKAAAGKSMAATFGATPVSNWYSALLNAAGRAYVNKTGTTQFRLRFATDDNDNNVADTMRFFSGNAGVAARPQLIIEYTIP